MRPAYQADIHPDAGDCFRAALASILEVPTTSLPTFGTPGDEMNHGWFELVHSYLARFGLGLLMAQFRDGQINPCLPEAWVLVQGESGGGAPHVVVGRIVHGDGGAAHLELVHDVFPYDALATRDSHVLEMREVFYGRCKHRMLKGDLADWLIFFVVVCDPARYMPRKGDEKGGTNA